MILNNTKDVMETNIVPNTSHKFAISDVGLVMEILSGLYKYPIRTLVQEYICNGRDAMREAGTWGKVPMIISVPNTFCTEFRVRDFGVGLSPERVENVFVNYGSSTKRNTNTQTGGFGIGAKSVFAYTDSFTVVSFYNGHKYTYLCYMTREKGGCDLISKELTTEANGVEIIIGVKRNSIEEFKQAVQRCILCWKEDIIIKGCSSSEILRMKPIKSIDNFDIYKTNGREIIFLVDGVQYSPLENYMYNIPIENGYSLVVNVPNGKFKLSPSRESIILNDENKKIEYSLMNQMERLIQDHIKKIDSKKELKDKLLLIKEYNMFSKIERMEIQLDDTYKLHYSNLKKIEHYKYLTTRFIQRSRRGLKLSIKTNDKCGGVFIPKTILVYTKDDKEPNTLSRRLNFLVETRGEAITILESIDKIPFDTELGFVEILNSNDLPKPVFKKGVSNKPKKTVADATYFSYDECKIRSRDKITNLRPTDLLVEYSDTLDLRLAKVFKLIEIPECNKEITKYLKIRTQAEAIKYLEDNWDTYVTVKYKKFKVKGSVNGLEYSKLRSANFRLLNGISKVLDKKLKALDDFEKMLEDKVPLLKVYNKVNCSYLPKEMKILEDEINKQLSEV